MHVIPDDSSMCKEWETVCFLSRVPHSAPLEVCTCVSGRENEPQTQELMW